MSSGNDPSCVDVVFESAARKAHISGGEHEDVALMKAIGGGIPKSAKNLGQERGLILSRGIQALAPRLKQDKRDVAERAVARAVAKATATVAVRARAARAARAVAVQARQGYGRRRGLRWAGGPGKNLRN